MSSSYLKALFNPGELTAFAQSPTDCTPSLVFSKDARPPCQWVTVNPVKKWKTDANVTALRNMLIEFDKGYTLDEQMPYVIKSGFPITTAVYSGNKSIHFVCALSEPVSEPEFREIRRRLDIIFPGMDKSVKDLARFTRCADGVNLKTGNQQELLVLDKRVAPSRLASFLARYDTKITAHDEAQARMLAQAAEEKADLRARSVAHDLSESSWRFLRGEEGVKLASRHNRLYAIVCELCDEMNMEYEDTLALAISCADAQGMSAQAGREFEAEKIVYDVYFKRRPR